MDTILSNTKRYFKNKKENKIILEKNFKIKHSFEKRFEESKNILEKYPNRIPIICERLTTEIPDIDRSKYLCPDDLSIANFMYVIRKRIKLSPEKSIYLFVDNKVIPATSSVLGVIYKMYKDDDGFLYIGYGGESTFG